MSKVFSMKDVFNLYRGNLESFSIRFSVPYRTVVSWSSGIRKPPQYVIDLFMGAVLCDLGYCTNEDFKQKFKDP